MVYLSIGKEKKESERITKTSFPFYYSFFFFLVSSLSQFAKYSTSYDDKRLTCLMILTLDSNSHLVGGAGLELIGEVEGGVVASPSGFSSFREFCPFLPKISRGPDPSAKFATTTN